MSPLEFTAIAEMLLDFEPWRTFLHFMFPFLSNLKMNAFVPPFWVPVKNPDSETALPPATNPPSGVAARELMYSPVEEASDGKMYFHIKLPSALSRTINAELVEAVLTTSPDFAAV